MIGEKPAFQVVVSEVPFVCSEVINPCFAITVTSKPRVGEVISANNFKVQSNDLFTKTLNRIYTAADGGLTVDVEVTVPTSTKGGLVKIKYVYNNKVPIQDAQAMWKISYVDANDQLIIKQISVPIGGSELRGIVGEDPVSQKYAPEEPFLCKKVVQPCFDITNTLESQQRNVAPEKAVAIHINLKPVKLFFLTQIYAVQSAFVRLQNHLKKPRKV